MTPSKRRLVVTLTAAHVSAFIPLASVDAQPLGPSRVLNDTAASDVGADDDVSLAISGSGVAVAVWTSTGALGGGDPDVLAARSADRGATWSPPQVLSTSSVADVRPTIATDRAGRWLVVWQSRDALGGTIGADFDLLATWSTDDGQTWTPPMPAVPTAATDAGDDVAPRIASDGAGRWMLVWSSTDDLGGAAGTDSDILVATYLDGDVSFSPPILLNPNAATDVADDRDPVVATNEAGTWVVAWSSTDTLGGALGDDFDLLTARTTDFGQTWSPAAALNSNAAIDTGDGEAVDLAGSPSGGWVAVWQSDEPAPWGPDLDILVAGSQSDGLSWSPVHALYTFSLIELGHEHDPRVVTDLRGNWWVVWSRVDSLPQSGNTDADILQARSTNFGMTWAGPELINDDAMTDTGQDYRPAAATTRNGDWVAAWVSTDSLGGTIGTDTDLLVAIAGCGDGILHAGEACDDGNVADGDCCSSSCEVEPSGTLCRAAAGACDVAETCDGVAPICPPDQVSSAGVECRAAAGSCDLPESCDGSSPLCPIDAVQIAGLVCRPAAGLCDAAEVCDGASALCPTDEFAPASTPCRAAAGPCDLTDRCTGTSALCADDRVPAGTECRGVAGACDVAEACDGVAVDCPPDRFATGVVCRPPNDACDGIELCDGAAPDCPADAPAPAGTPCRAAGDACDVTEVCDGVGFACPPDLAQPDGTQCSDGVVCNGSERCMGGACVAGSALDCTDTDLCTAEACFEPGGCGAVPVAGCCNQDPDCDDGDLCTDDTCSGPGGVCTHAPIADCCVGPADCDDGDPCTVDVCRGPGGSCTHSLISGCCVSDADCDDGSACTADACDVAAHACVSEPIPECCATDADCDDADACTSDRCDASTGTCENAVLAGCCETDADCDDADPCTADACGESGCESVSIPGCCVADADCTASNACGEARCNAETMRCEETAIAGCCLDDADCPATSCGTRRCDTTTNECVASVLTPGCCSVDSECDDFDACTFDRCTEAGCRHEAIEGCPLEAGLSVPAPSGESEDPDVSLSGPSPEPDEGFVLDDDGCECSTHRSDPHGGFLVHGLLCALGLCRRRR